MLKYIPFFEIPIFPWLCSVAMGPKVSNRFLWRIGVDIAEVRKEGPGGSKFVWECGGRTLMMGLK